MEKQTKLINSYPFMIVSTGFLMVAILLLTLGAFVQEKNFLFGIFFTEYILILLPVFVFGIIGKVNIKKALRIKKISFSVIWRIVIISILFLPVVGLVNYFAIFLLSFGNNVTPNVIPSADTAPTLVKHFILIAFSAGLCEEFFFRGMIMNSLVNKIGTRWSIFGTAFLFGIFHFNMQNFLGPFILGILFGHLILITDSIWSSVIAHTVNNGMAVFLGFVFSNQMNSPVEVNEVVNMSPNEYVPVLIFLLFISLISIIVVRKIFQSIVKIQTSSLPISDLQTQTTMIEYNDEGKKFIKYYELLPIIIVCAIYIVSMIISLSS